MPKPQFTEKTKTNYRWLSIVYQSNDVLNKENHGPVKTTIVEHLMKSTILDIKEIHSYIHGQIIIGVTPDTVIKSFNEAKAILQKKLVSHAPPLMFSLEIIAASNDVPPFSWMYIEGDDDLNENFHNSIKHIFPKALIKSAPAIKLIPRKQ